MKVQFFMTPNPAVVQSHDLVDEASSIMRQLEVRHLPVVDGQKLVGVVSQRDVANASVALLGRPVSQIMSSPPLTVTPEDEIVDAARILLAHHISGLPVVTDDGGLVGVITTTNCLVALVQLHHELDRRPDR